MTDNNEDPVLQQAVMAMRDGSRYYFDVVIICTSDDHQAAYWMEQLSQSCPHSKVLAVSEDWLAPGGAGNGLGTLYAWHKACALAKERYDGMDLAAALRDGSVSASLYHTAGKGTRMAPLPASENNNKPGVKLPFPLTLPDGTIRPISVLEAVLRQTAVYARKGRLSVFWGDQVFLPTAPFDVPPTHHADILCTLLGDTVPTPEEWHAQGLEKYGVIAVLQGDNSDSVEAAQVEKVTQETALQLLQGLPGTLKQVGPSLGSFSVSAVLLQALMAEFSTELSDKTGKLDTDPHFWMPLTLPLESYVQLMQQKGTSEADAKQHFERMTKMKATFLEQNASSGLGFFGAVNVGKGAYWWDYGQLKLYSQNARLLLEPDSNSSARLLRQFLGLSSPESSAQPHSHVVGTTCAEGCQIDDVSYVIASRLGAASQVTQSLVAGTACPELHSEGAIVVHCAAPLLRAGPGAIVYNVLSEGALEVPAGHVYVGLSSCSSESGDSSTTNVRFDEILKSRMDIDGGQAWKIKVEGNAKSFEEINVQNHNADIALIAHKRREEFERLAKSMGL